MKTVKIIFFIGLCIGLVALILSMLSRNDSAFTEDPALTELRRDAPLCQGSLQGCWHGIYPGQTTFDEAERLLQKDSAIIDLTRREGDLVALNPKENARLHYLLWETKWTRGSACCYYEHSDVPIETVTLSLRNAQLGDLIDLLGQPRGFDIYVRPYCYPYTVGNIVVANIAFDYVLAQTESLGKYEPQSSQTWRLTSETGVTELTYFSSDEPLQPSSYPGSYYQYSWQGYPTMGPNLERKCDLRRYDGAREK